MGNHAFRGGGGGGKVRVKRVWLVGDIKLVAASIIIKSLEQDTYGA